MPLPDRIRQLRRVKATRLQKDPRHASRRHRRPREVEVPEAWQILVDCRDEANQKALFERLTGEGYECRALTL